MENRAELIFRAQLAEKAERYDEMAAFMKEVAVLGKDLEIDERNLLSVAYKNAAGSRRASWRIIYSLEMKQKTKGNTAGADAAGKYREKIEKELNDLCTQVLDLLDEHLVKNAANTESQVFYEKMKGDYYRYIAEFERGDSRAAAGKKGQEAYERAMKSATEHLTPTNPIRLGLALNYSVFNFEILEKPKDAIEMAQEAFDDAIRELDSVTEESYRDSTLIMQLIKDNLSLWNQDSSGTQAEVAAQ